MSSPDSICTSYDFLRCIVFFSSFSLCLLPSILLAGWSTDCVLRLDGQMLNFLLVFCSSCFGLEHHGKCVLHPSILHFGILRPWLFIDLSLFPISLIFFSFFLLCCILGCRISLFLLTNRKGGIASFVLCYLFKNDFVGWFE